MVLLHYCSNLKKKIHSSSRGITSCPYKHLGHIINHSKTIWDTIAPCWNVSWQPHKPMFKFLQDIHLSLLCENNTRGHFDSMLVTCWVVPHQYLQHKAFCISPVKKPPDSKASDPLTSPPNAQFYPWPHTNNYNHITYTAHTQYTLSLLNHLIISVQDIWKKWVWDFQFLEGEEQAKTGYIRPRQAGW